MTSKAFTLQGYRRLLMLCAVALLAVTGCAKDTVPVNIHGVNYTGQEFSFTIVDPANSENFGGGELIAPFSAGGTMCCYTLPTTWRAGIKVQINGKHFLPEKPDGSLPEVKETKVVEVPPYMNGKPGELWVLRGVDGALSLVLSDFQPDHAKWPGKVKGWPTPSVEYQRERWDLYIKLEQDLLDSYKQSMQEFADSPDMHAEEVWKATEERFPEIIQSFKGSDDKGYREYLLKYYQNGLAAAQAKVKGLKDSKP